MSNMRQLEDLKRSSSGFQKETKQTPKAAADRRNTVITPKSRSPSVKLEPGAQRPAKSPKVASLVGVAEPGSPLKSERNSLLGMASRQMQE